MDPQPYFDALYQDLIIPLESKTKQLYKSIWLLETTGSHDAKDLQASLSSELKLLLSSENLYQQLISLRDSGEITQPIKKRILEVLILQCEQNRLPKEYLLEISEKEAELAQMYSHFRPEFEGKPVSENDLIEILKSEKKVERRKEAWQATKSIGAVLAPKILELVSLRNQAAHRLGYSDYYEMQLKLQEMDKLQLLQSLEDLKEKSAVAYKETLTEINNSLATRFKVPISAIGPWAWSEPFCQEDPLSNISLDEVVKDSDFIDIAKQYFRSIQLPVEETLKISDLYEREHKNQHAFCISIDRYKDVRILTNLRPSIKWLETLLHELGHAVYDLHYDVQLPWILRTPPHMLTTEAIALLMGRLAYQKPFLEKYIKPTKDFEAKLEEATHALKRRQLIFSRWVMVMVNFEAQLYANPQQNLNTLWWKLVQKYQGIYPSEPRIDKFDWAAKYHVGLAPVYYHSYLLGEMFASMLIHTLSENHPETNLLSGPQVGHFLKDHVFNYGNRFPWNELVKIATNHDLSADAWIKDFT